MGLEMGLLFCSEQAHLGEWALSTASSEEDDVPNFITGT